MSDLHKFIFEGMPVRGMLVRLTDGWREVLQRRATAGAWAPPVRGMLGQMAAAATLMQANLKFNGALILQVQGDGPVKLAVAEVSSDLRFRVTAKVDAPVADDAELHEMVNPRGRARCAITLDPLDRQPGQQPYQGIVPLATADGLRVPDVAAMLEHYMRQSEQLETRLVLAANDEVAAGLLIQRLPVAGPGAVAGSARNEDDEESFHRIAHLSATLTAQELLTLDASTLLHRLYWEETLRVFAPQTPQFACSCSSERVRSMLRSLGREESDGIIAERGEIEVACEFCGQQYRFDAVDVGEMFTPERDQPPVGSRLH